MSISTPKLANVSRISKHGIYALNENTLDPELLRKALIRRRMLTLSNPSAWYQNIAVMSYKTGKKVRYLTAINKPGTPMHSECWLINFALVNDATVVQMYSERHPCGYCYGMLVGQPLVHEVDIGYSVNPYTRGKKENDCAKDTRKMTKQELKIANSNATALKLQYKFKG